MYNVAMNNRLIDISGPPGFARQTPFTFIHCRVAKALQWCGRHLQTGIQPWGKTGVAKRISATAVNSSSSNQSAHWVTSHVFKYPIFAGTDKDVFTWHMVNPFACRHSAVCVLSFCVQVLQQELPYAIQHIFDSLTETPDSVPESSWRLASPKSLVDNFCHTMHCLFSDCFVRREAQDCE